MCVAVDQDADVATLELMVDHLTQFLAEKKRKDTMLAVDVLMGAVWMRESAKWMKVCGVVHQCPNNYGVCVSRVSDGMVVAGGYWELGEDSLEVSSQCNHFSLSTGQWRELESMRTPRHWASAAEVEEMMLLLVGGRETGDRVSGVCEWLDIRRGVWTSAASLPKPLAKPLVASAAGRVYILDQDEFSDRLLVEYDPASDTHTYKTSLPCHVQDTLDASLVSVKDSIYLFGGEQRLSLHYEPATDQWHELLPNAHMASSKYYPIERSTSCCGPHPAVCSDILLCIYRWDSDEGHRSISYNVATKQWKVLDFCLPF